MCRKDDRHEGKVAKAGSPAGSTPAAPSRGHGSLPHMPVEVIELIGKPLSLKERVSLTSCSRTLATHPDIHSSIALWHTLDIHTQPQQQASLAGWLARRRPAVRKLRLEGPCEAIGVLASLAGGPLEQLQLQTQWGGGSAGAEEDGSGEGTLSLLSTLRGLGGLTRLEARGLHLDTGLPWELGTLSALLELDLSRSLYSPGSGVDGAAAGGAEVQPEPPGVRCLTPPQLTHLSLSNCGLKALPSELSALTSLASLDISSNMQLRRGGAGAFGHLRHLQNLQRLDLGQCYLQCLPFELESLSGLRELIASRNHLTLGEGAAAGQAAGAGVAWRPLKGLSQLTRLDISCCGLAALPEQLSSLTLLEELAAGSNQLLAYGGEAAFAPLQQLTGNLHTLDLSQCELHRLPSALSTLGSLTRLELSWNGGLGSEAAWAPAAALTALRRLGAKGCGLRRRRVPPALKQLKRLQEMDLGGAGEAATGPGTGREELQHLAAFTALSKAGEREQERGVSSI